MREITCSSAFPHVEFPRRCCRNAAAKQMYLSRLDRSTIMDTYPSACPPGAFNTVRAAIALPKGSTGCGWIDLSRYSTKQSEPGSSRRPSNRQVYEVASALRRIECLVAPD